MEDIVKAENADAQSSVEEYFPAFKVPAAIRGVKEEASVVNTSYHSLKGQCPSKPQRGAIIVTEYKDNGTRTVRKIVK